MMCKVIYRFRFLYLAKLLILGPVRGKEREEYICVKRNMCFLVLPQLKFNASRCVNLDFVFHWGIFDWLRTKVR